MAHVHGGEVERAEHPDAGRQPGDPQPRRELARALPARSAPQPRHRERGIVRRLSELAAAPEAPGVSRPERGPDWDPAGRHVRHRAGAAEAGPLRKLPRRGDSARRLDARRADAPAPRRQRVRRDVSDASGHGARQGGRHGRDERGLYRLWKLPVPASGKQIRVRDGDVRMRTGVAGPERGQVYMRRVRPRDVRGRRRDGRVRRVPRGSLRRRRGSRAVRGLPTRVLR